MSVGCYARLRSASAKQGILATILVFTLLAGIVPFNLVNSTEMCTMSCCATRGPHSVASHCSDSVCHLNPTAPKELEVVKQESAEEDGHAEHSPDTKPAPQAVTEESSAVPHPDHKHPTPSELSRSDAHHPEPLAVMSGAVIASACPRSCGALAGYSFNQHRPSEPSTLAALPSSRTLHCRISFSPALLSSLLQQQFPPRAPPFILS